MKNYDMKASEGFPDYVTPEDKQTLNSLLSLTKKQIIEKLQILHLTNEQYFDFISVLEQFKIKRSKLSRIYYALIYAVPIVVFIFILIHFHIIF